jgi:hypothetical protein
MVLNLYELYRNTHEDKLNPIKRQLLFFLLTKVASFHFEIRSVELRQVSLVQVFQILNNNVFHVFRNEENYQAEVMVHKV